MKLRLLLPVFSLFLLATFTLPACGADVEVDDTRSADEKNLQPMPLNTVVILSAQELQAKRDAGALVLDSRDLEDYRAGHLKGAIRADEEALFKDASGFVKSDVVTLQDAARSIGLSREKEVVIYGSGNSASTGRLFWSLEYLGHGNVFVYLDGYENLKKTITEEASTEEVQPEQGDFVVSLRQDIYAGLDLVKSAVKGETEAILIDTRRYSEHEGVEARDDDPRQGAIPNSVFYYWEDVLNEQGALKPKDQLRQELEAAGVWKENALILPYCQTGTRSATVYAVFRWLGHKNVKNYDGSWVEWSRQSDQPVEVEANPTSPPGKKTKRPPAKAPANGN